MSILTSLVMTVKGVNIMIHRLNLFNKLTSHILFKEEEFTDLGYKLSTEHLKTLIERVKNKEVGEIEKLFYVQNDLFYEQIIIILVEVNSKLKRIVEIENNGTIYLK